MDKSELLQHARAYATTQDLYALLGVSSDAPSAAMHRAWRKASLPHHPDKAGSGFDAERWQLYERARDVLSSGEAREAYDAARGAALLRERQRLAMDAQRRAMVEDLEARERAGAGGVGVKRMRPGDDAGKGAVLMSEAERRRLAEAGRRRLDERKRLMREAEERERERERSRKEEQEKDQDGGPAHTEAKSNDTRDGEQPRRRRETSPPDVSLGAGATRMDTDPPAPKENGDGGVDNDEYDGRIADIERRLQEARERKAAKKARKSGVVPQAAASPTMTTTRRDDVPHATPVGKSRNLSSNPQKADVKTMRENGGGGGPPSAKSFSFSTPSSTTAADTPPKPKGDFSSMMARLRAAQLEKDARKKTEAEAEAAAAAIAP